MRALTLQPVNLAPGEQRQQQATCGRSLSSNYAPLSLENKILAQASLQMSQPSSCASLQPSSLSSTSSSLLSCSSLLPSITSSLLSTQNRLLTSDSPRFSFPLTSSITADTLLPTSLPSGALLNRLAQPPSFLHPGLGEQQKTDVGGDVDREEISEEIQCSFDGISVQQSEEDDSSSEEDYVCSTLELPSLETDSVSKEIEPAAVTQEEFPVFDRGNEKFEEELKDKKYLLLNAVCCSLVSKSTPPGQDTWDAEDSVWTNITNLAKDICVHDPEFLLKVAVYARQELNIRITANFLLALAANQPSTKPHVRRYFCVAVQLPSDWLEVVRIYSTCFSHSLPMCLKKAMADKFKQFSEYQLAKYNTRKHRCKRSPKSRKGKKPTEAQLKQWADTLRSEPSILKKFLMMDKKVVDKKQSEFTMKKMIKRLHLKEPAKHIMAILGKKYPADLKAFNHSGMKGVWERERAGQRMKLKEPETWERLVSAEGNKAATWEKLIDNNSLPFMAMLRNLRNMITQSISEAHHKKILSRLSDKKAVIQSRQFPFRFLAAYKVIMELHALASTAQQAVPSAQEILKGILKKFPKCKRTRSLDWETTDKKRVKMTLCVPFVYQKYRLKKAQLLKANQRQFTVALLQRYREALETAVQISCRYNVPPLPGRTAVILFTDLPNTRNWDQKQDFCLPPESEEKGKEEDDDEEWEDEEEEEEDDEEEEEEEEEASSLKRRRRKKEENEDKLSPSMMEAAMLLSLMICSSAEDGQLHLVDYSHGEEAKLKSDVLLENVRSVMKQVKSFEGVPHEERDKDYLFKVFTKTNKIDNIIVVVDHSHSHVNYMINNYRKEVNNQPLVVQIVFGGYARPSTDRNHVVLPSFSEQILRFVAERGSTRLMDHVDHLDKLYNVPPPEGAKDPQSANSVVSIPVGPKLRWRGVRVFISSTFRDMHAERDILVRSVFPELRRRAASHCLYLQEVELRWGVTEEESCRATELCLSEVCRSQMMVGVLGERYGLVPPKPVLPDLPQYSWLASAPAGLSITEMEIRQFQALFPDSANQRMFCYFRDPNMTKSVPVAWRSDFSPESKEAESKMASLKSSIRASDVKVTENYPCEWGGVVEGKPYLKNLEDFGKAVLDDLWTAVVKQFVEEDEDAEAASDVTEQEVHQGALQRQFFGRAKLLSRAVEVVEQVQTKGGMMVVDGGPGEGKTVFMAALADALRTRDKSRSNLVCDVMSYSTAASQSARSVQNLLRCLVQWFRKMKNTEKKSPLPHSYKDLLSEFHSALSDVKRNKPLVLMVDGMDGVQDGGGQLNSDWIPQQLPQGVCLIVSITPKADLLQTLVKRRSTVPFTLGQLTMPDRREIIQRGLEAFGKKLSDTAFNNQLQNLIMKKGAMSPLFLHLACEDLRNFASFDQLKETLQALPESLSQLVQHNLDRLCSQHRGILGLRWTLAVLTVSPTGLRERDLYSVLNTCNHLSSQDRQVSWQDVLQLSRTPKGRVPMATFTGLVQSLRSLIGSSHWHNTDDLLSLTNPEVRQSFEDFLLPAESDRTRAHLVLAAHLWTLADPQETNTFLHCEANSLMHLPSNLIQSGQLEALGSLLSSYYFLYACVRHGLLHHLLETYSLYVGGLDHLEDCWSFLRRHASLLSSCPPLFIQQAFNEPPETSAHIWAQGMVGKGGIRVVECLNNKDQIDQDTSELVSTFSSDPTCLDVSPDGELMVVGTGQGTLDFINTQTGQKVKSLVSSCDGISSCVFLKDGHLATTSFDGRIEIWEIKTGCRTALIKGHTNVITASNISADHRHLATVSLDFMLKVWSSTQCHEVAALPSSSPMNCVTFDPEGRLLAAGCWDGKVIVWNWLQDETQTSLCGHQRSVRSVSFSSSSSMLCSGSISGEVRVWSVPTSTCVGCFQAHHGATEVITFLDEGAMLLTGGSDHMLQLWSGGLGRSVTALKSDNCDLEPPEKKLKTVNSVSAALCVAVNGDYAAVGYHGEGIKLFSLDSGKIIWSSRDLDVSILCLLWVALDAEQTKPELLVSGGSDKHLRVWRREEGEEGTFGGLGMVGTLGVQPGDILALAQNSTYLATASDNFTIALWLLSDLSVDSHVEPHVLLRGHRGGVTCLAFSPDGGQLLSGGKDTALMVWDMNPSPPVLSKSLPHSHRDWITGCVWTPDCVISSSNDGRLCLWDLQTGKQLREITWRSSLTSVCCLGQYVIAGCGEGALHVWSWETNIEIGHISAHKQRIHHCSLLTDTDKNKEVNPEEMTVLTASDDGTVQLWKPLQMQHFNSFLGHSGTIHGVVRKRGVPEFLTVSEDCSLRSWTWTTKSPLRHSDPITALCFSQNADLCLAGYTSGLLEMWQHNAVVCRKQASDGSVTAICSLSDGQFAVGNSKYSVDVWKLVWNQQHDSGSLVKVTTYTVTYPLVSLFFCSSLIGVSSSGLIFDITKDRGEIWSWYNNVRILSVNRNSEMSMWLMGEEEGEVRVGFIFTMNPKMELSSAFNSMKSNNYEEDDEGKEKRPSPVTAVTMDREFIVCGDMRGNMWFNQTSEVSMWTSRKPAHDDRISVLRLTESTIISASYDKTVKLWDRTTEKQVGMFVCGGPVLALEVNPEKPTELVCADGQGKLYFLSWKE
ncbi:telomerase protein component 1 isoform X4 [Hippoglossus hippoglossus]|uniref:telomerase protein component 1 isoform X4 n=1 Tax=Hippoglossus hippoglossus TaxID=8267 RepID=UPI00148E66FA|nr:telomerase protein component 1 isoform X4 [Hippoglossus hippoglossus]